MYKRQVKLDGEAVNATVEADGNSTVVKFADGITIATGQTLSVDMSS